MLYVLLALLLSACWLCLRAARFTPPALPDLPAPQSSANEKALADKLGALVRFPTVSHPDRALDDESAFEGFRRELNRLYPKVSARCAPELVAGRGLIYHWKGQNSDRPRVLMAHYDVVPADESRWSKPPFSGEVADGFVYGRGTLDTKGTLAALMDAAERLIREGHIPQQDIYLCFSGDEEVFGPTTPRIIDRLKERGVAPDFVLDEGGAVVEDTFPGVSRPCALIGTAEKGMTELVLKAATKPGHASAPPRHTAIGMTAKAVCRMEGRVFSYRLTPPVRQLFDTLGRHTPFAYRVLFANLGFFSPLMRLITPLMGGEFNALTHTTCAFTMARAGLASNVLPPASEIVANVRILPGETKDSVQRRAQKRIGARGITALTRFGDDPSPVSRTDDEEWLTLANAVRQVWPEAIVSPYLMIACSDARHYSRISHHVYRFSAMALSKEERGLIHGDNERISAKELCKASVFYETLMRRL